jgi:hypothetical protein
MPVLKRATQKLREAGIEHIEVRTGLYGPYLLDPRLKRQNCGRVYKTWQEAVKAAIDGARPTPMTEEGKA